MSQENVETFKRANQASNRRDIEALLEVLDPEVEWYPALLASMAGGAAVYRGHEGAREYFRDVDEAFIEIHAEYPEIRDLGDRLVAIGHMRMRGKASGVETESPNCLVIEFKNGKVTRVHSYFDPKEGLEAVGLEE